MRSFEQRIAEIDRRSEKIFKERRQRRKHMLVVCIPLVLCITTFSAFILPAMMPADSKGSAGSAATETAMGGLTEGVASGFFCSITQIDVSGVDVSLLYTERGDIQLISKKLYSYGGYNPENNCSVNEESRDEIFEENADGDDTAGGVTSDLTNTGITITLTMYEGRKIEYYLDGNTLTNRSVNHVRILSPKEVNELRALLGIPQQ